MRNPLLAARLFHTPLMAHPAKAETVARVFLSRGASVSLHASPSRERAGLQADMIGVELDRRGIDPYPIVDGIAIITIEGSLVTRGSWIDAESGLLSYQSIQAQVLRATRSPGVRGVVLDFDSPGGEVAGMFETAGMVRELSAAKPTLAVVGSMAASAAYALASQARRIVASEDSIVGAIGSVMLHVDESRALANDGIDVTIIRSGPRKFAGNSAEPLPAWLSARMQARVEQSASRFAELVAAARRGRITAEQALATEGGDFYAAEALELGLIDAVGEPSAAFAAFRAALNGA